jgi:hypothetical protein
MTPHAMRSCSSNPSRLVIVVQAMAAPGDQKQVIEEISGSLFDGPTGEGVAWAHCVSACFTMGAGIALEFRRRFGNQAELLKQKVSIGGVATLKDPATGTLLCYLVTKAHYWQKPTYSSLVRSLLELRQLCVKHHIYTLCIPRLGCGLDRLEWDKVKALIVKHLSDVVVAVKVFTPALAL